MLCVRPRGRWVLVLAAVVILSQALRANDRSWRESVKSKPTDELIALADELDYSDPILANHRLGVEALTQLLERGLSGQQKAAAHYRRAIFQLKLGDKQKALSDVEAALIDSPDNPEYLLAKGSLLFDLGKTAEGQEWAKKAVSTNQELLLAHKCYQHVAASADVSVRDGLLLKNAEPVLAMTPHPYFRSATSFFAAGKYVTSMRRIEEYLKHNPFDAQSADTAYMIWTVASSKCPSGDSQRPTENEILRRAILGWNLVKSPGHRSEISKALLRSLHYTSGTKYPGTILAVSGALIDDTRLEPRNVAATRYVRAKAFATLGRYGEALAEIESAMKATPGETETRAFRVELLTWMEQYEKALAECDETLKTAPDHVPTLLLKAQIQAGCPVEKFRDGKSAMKLATKACELAKNNNARSPIGPQKLLVLASAEAGDYESADRTVKDLRSAADTLDEVAVIDRLARQIREQKPWMLERRSDNSRLDRRKKLYRELAGSQPNLQVAFLQAHHEKTCDELLADKSLTADERDFCLRRRSVARYCQNKMDLAISDLEALLRRAPKDASLYLMLCRCHLAKHNLEFADQSYAKLETVQDGSAGHRFTCDLVKAEIDLARVEAGVEKGERQEKVVARTIEQIDTLVRKYPRQPGLSRLRAAARYHAGEPELALADSEACFKSAPFTSHKEMVDTVYTHARILEKLNRFDHSLQYASMAMHLEGEGPRIRTLLARIYETTGKTALAGMWRGPDSPAQSRMQPIAESTPAK